MVPTTDRRSCKDAECKAFMRTRRSDRAGITGAAHTQHGRKRTARSRHICGTFEPSTRSFRLHSLMLLSAALSGTCHRGLRQHLLRSDHQEDLCFAVWRPSTGSHRKTALVSELVLPQPGERHVHGTASFETAYFLRAAEVARATGGGLAFLHSHPGGSSWQDMSAPDRDTESRHASRTRAITGLPLVGLTMAGDGSLSARFWERIGRSTYHRRDCESVRVAGEQIATCWHPQLRPKPEITDQQIRTVSAWGDDIQADLARLRIGVVGAGSVGAMVTEALARSGVQDITLIDFDTIEFKNLDRLIHATELDA